MEKNSATEQIKRIIIGLALSVLLSFAIYAVSLVFLTTVFYHDQYGERNFTPIYIVMVFFFQLSFWACYTRKTSDEISHVVQKTFSWKEGLINTLLGEGKMLIIILLVLGVVFEASLILYAKYAEIPGQNPFATALMPVFSLAMCTGIEDLPILRTIVAYFATVVLIIAQIVVQHHHDYKKWNG